jgi:hypothetical protein
VAAGSSADAERGSLVVVQRPQRGGGVARIWEEAARRGWGRRRGAGGGLGEEATGVRVAFSGTHLK